VIAIGALLAVLAGRLVQLQGLESTSYAASAEQQRLRKVDLVADRGEILDRHGRPLALDIESRGIYADPRLIRKADPPGARLEEWASALSFRLHVPLPEVKERLRRDAGFVYLARGVTPEVARDVVALKIPGVNSLPETLRTYPSGSLAANVVGFVGREGDGLGGIESSWNKVLAGHDGRMLVEEDTRGLQIPSGTRRIEDPKPGTDAVLTLHRDIQWYAESTLAAQVAATGSKGGTVIVMDAHNGQILALATVPTFDPNNAGKAAPAARGNWALSSVYEPGSVNKIITAAAALETGAYQPASVVEVPGSIRIGGHTFHDAHSHGVERLTFTGVLAKSSNIGTIEIAQRLGKQTVYDFLRRFGLGSRTGIKFPGESPGLLPPPDKWSGSQVGTVPIGQGISATALQIVTAYATIANGGVNVQPSLVLGTRDKGGKLRPAALPTRRRAISEDTAAKLRLMLEAVTDEGGTATRAAIPGYRVAGKTGTARKVKENGLGYDSGRYISSFVGFAPADRPRLVVEVVLDEPHSSIYGGIVAAPVFRSVMGFALGALRIPPTGVPPPVPVPLLAP
jgi:cell division protein FtsI (penicillin-binding protein 3)